MGTHTRVVTGPVALLLALFAGGCEDPHAQEKAAIIASLEQLDEANRRCDGDAAVAVMSSASLSEYTRLVMLALDGSRLEVLSLSPSDQMQIVSLRNRLSRQQLESMDGREYQRFATASCWYDFAEEGDPGYEGSIGDIKVLGDFAYADVLNEKGRPSGVSAEFSLEDGVWKVNEFTFQRVYDEELRAWAAEEDMTVEEYIVMFEEWQTGRPVEDSVWEPMR